MDLLVDARGLSCPLPAVLARRAAPGVPPGAALVVLATDPEAPIDVAAVAADAGLGFSAERTGEGWRMTLRRAGPFPPGFFDRMDPAPDAAFYAAPRFVHHIDDGAVAAVGALYEELGIDGRVLDLMSSWVSHFTVPPEELVGVGMNAAELAGNPALAERVVQDLNADPALPFPDASFDHAVCCVSVDYLTRPLEVFAEVARVLRAGALFACTFSNRCFPTKAIRGWLASDDGGHVAIVRRYFELAPGFGPPSSDLRTPLTSSGDPVWAVWAAAIARDATASRRP